MSTQTLDSLCSVNPETLGTATPMDMEFRYLDISAVTKGRIDWSATQMWKYADAPSRARRRLRSGDVLLCTVRPGLQAHARIRQYEDVPLVGSTGFAVLRPNLADDSGFVFHQIFSDSVAAQLRALETGSSYPAVNEGDVRRVRVFCPEKEERWRIAAVLDTVDEAIAKTEAVIAKLRQVRTGLLHDLLTRGLDPHGHLRDPVAHPEQFQDTPRGRIPARWSFGALGDFINLLVGPAFESNRFSKGGEGVRLLRGLNVTQGHVRWGEGITERWPQLTPDLAGYRLEVGDVVIGMDGALVGRNVAALTAEDVPSILVQRVARIRGLPQLKSAYAYLLLTIPSFLRHIDTRKTHTAIPHITAGDIREYPVTIPTPDEQQQVLNVVSAADSEIKTTEQELTKLVSLKSGLMTDLLTGRVRVPELDIARNKS